jgi:3-hydroxyacyl-[acyl-carrier-protein] dehydratase
MKLLDDYYRIIDHISEGKTHVFTIALLPDYCAYQGHFPDNPIAPGVCNIRMIKELAELVIGKKLFISYLVKCRFLKTINPLDTGELQVSLELTETDVNGIVSLTATCRDVSSHVSTYMEIKAELTAML